MKNDNYEYDLLEQIQPLLKNMKLPSRKGFTGCCDWLSCTFDCFYYEPDNMLSNIILDDVSNEKIKSLLRFFGKENVNLNSLDRDRGTSSFKYSYVLQEGCTLLMYGPECSNGNHATALNISGSGMSKLFRDKMLIPLLKYCQSHAYKYTRFDFALDCFEDVFPISKAFQLSEQGFYICKSNKFTIKGTPKDGDFEGITLYYGEGSDMLLRIYRKNYEQNIQDKVPFWDRWELQIRDHDRIKQLVLLLIIAFEHDNYFDYFNFGAGILRDFIEFKMKTNDSNKSRWPIDNDYYKFINCANSIKLFAYPVFKTNFDTSLDWFVRSVSLFMTQLYLIYGDKKFFDFIKALIVKKYPNLKNKDFDFIKNALAETGYDFDKNICDKIINKLYDSIPNMHNFINDLYSTDDSIGSKNE